MLKRRLSRRIAGMMEFVVVVADFLILSDIKGIFVSFSFE